MNKKIILSLLLVCALAMPVFAKAITTDDLKAQIAALQAQITQLLAQLAQQQGETTTWCHTFNTNLGMSSSGAEVEALQTALAKDGAKSWEYKGYDGDFDEMTASVVVAFQEKYKSEILTPSGLKHGTGFVGKSTRAKLNKLYGCGSGPVACAPIVEQCPDGSFRFGCAGDQLQCSGPIATSTTLFTGTLPVSCVGEGGQGGTESISKSTSCCAGLSKVDRSGIFEGICDNASRQSIYQWFTCIKCGNGVCGAGENSCNCPADCK